ncbi:invasion associated locus B family protein [Microvirga sp. RSM25]|uniref:invasion associated locus B family protein n=1 Tax=Microvirga sp. RSM25 TaxID=3273802 RepID=UPI00384E08BB
MTHVLLAMVATASAQEAPRTERFADWEVACASSVQIHQTSASPQPMVDCQVVQRLTAERGDDIVFAVTIVRSAQSAPVAIVSIPLGGYIVPGIELSVDGKKPYKLLIETCNAAGCHAGFSLSGRIDKELRSGKHANFRLWAAKDKPADATVSLKGLADALTRLERSS